MATSSRGLRALMRPSVSLVRPCLSHPSESFLEAGEDGGGHRIQNGPLGRSPSVNVVADGLGAMSICQPCPGSRSFRSAGWCSDGRILTPAHFVGARQRVGRTCSPRCSVADTDCPNLPDLTFGVRSKRRNRETDSPAQWNYRAIRHEGLREYFIPKYAELIHCAVQIVFSHGASPNG